MAINVAPKLFFKIVAIRDARIEKGIPFVGSARKETLGVEVSVAFTCFDSKVMGLSTTLEFMY